MFDETREMDMQSSLWELEVGMPVFDSDGVLLGKVVDVYDATDPFLDEIASALEFANIVLPAAARLREEGCMVVDTGTHTGSYHVLPSQIKVITEAGVFLNCNRTELIQI
jgi:hypothetical protein